jgi:hypothetical protein
MAFKNGWGYKEANKYVKSENRKEKRRIKEKKRKEKRYQYICYARQSRQGCILFMLRNSTSEIQVESLWNRA